MSDRPLNINGWELQDSADPIQQKIMAHWQLNKHLYENATQNLKGLCMLRLALHWWSDPAMREHWPQLVDQGVVRTTGGLLDFYEKSVGVQR